MGDLGTRIQFLQTVDQVAPAVQVYGEAGWGGGGGRYYWRPFCVSNLGEMGTFSEFYGVFERYLKLYENLESFS